MNLITDEGKYYLYRHIRLDKNEVFYVGIGTKKRKGNVEHIYRRAFAVDSRNKYWTNITNKSEYLVEIVLESNDVLFMKEKEKEFIALYGRKDLDKGTLCNLTDGGEGTHGLIVSEETRKKMSASLKGRVFTKEWIRKFTESNRGKVRSQETCKLLSIKLKGLKRTEEQKERMRLAQKQVDRTTIDYSNVRRGSQCHRAKLNELQVLEIKKLIEEHIPYKHIIDKYGIKSHTISAIAKGDTWKHITGFSRENSFDKRCGLNERTALNQENVLEIKKLLEEGTLKIKEIANQFNVNNSIISSISKGRIWKSLTGFNEDSFIDKRKNIRNLAKLDENKVKEIRHACSEKQVSKKNIAKQFGISYSTVKSIASNKTWKNI